MTKTFIERNGKTLCRLGLSVLVLVGCSNPVRTIEYRDGKMTMVEKGSDGISRLWEFKEVATRDERNALRKEGWKCKGLVDVSGSAENLYLMIRRIKPLIQAAGPAFHPMLITEFGARITADGSWRVTISESSLEWSRLSRPSEVEDPRSSWSIATSPEGWKAKRGWFVYVESQTNVWSYDGDRLLMLDTEVVGKNTGGGSLYSGGYPCAVPDEVFSHLSMQKRKEVQAGK